MNAVYLNLYKYIPVNILPFNIDIKFTISRISKVLYSLLKFIMEIYI